MRFDKRSHQSPYDLADREGVAAERALRLAARRHHTDRVVEIMFAGMVAGGTAGALAGLPGIIAGGIIGGITGALAGTAMDLQDARDAIRQRRLDATIGVMGGDIGAASPSQPPSRRSFVSMASAGVGGYGGRASEGPISSPDT